MDKMVVRLKPEDMAEVAALEALCFSAPWPEEQLRAVLEQPHFIAYGLRRQERLEAYISLSHAPGEMEVLNIATRPEARRCGYARRLLGLAVSMMPRLHVDRLLLEVRVSNIPALNLYTSMGFERVGLRKAYYRDTGEDALILCMASGSALPEPLA